jgi:arylsulfatase A-like enzyme
MWFAAFDPHRDYEEGIIPEPHQPEDVIVPPYLPDTPEVRNDLALYYDEISRMDSYVGKVMDELEKQGVAENTMVLFISDNGRPFPRAKTTLYDSGIKTPWIVHWPAQVEAGTTCSSLVSSVDIAPTMLELAGLSAAPTFEGKSFSPLLSDPGQQIRDYIYAEAHWHDYEKLTRAVRSSRFKYIRNFLSEYAKTPPADAVRSPTFQTMRRLRDTGELTEAQRVVFNKPSPEEELYDIEADPFELKNLANDPEYAGHLDQFRQELATFQENTGDRLPSFRTPDEFDRELGTPLPNRERPRPSKKELMSGSGE